MGDGRREVDRFTSKDTGRCVVVFSSCEVDPWLSAMISYSISAMISYSLSSIIVVMADV